MGIGGDGYFCGNMPGTTTFDKDIYTDTLVPGSKNYNILKQLIGKNPGELTVTFGPKTVLRAKQLVVIASGENH